MKKETIDFSGVPKEIRRGGGAPKIPEGEYLSKIVKVEKRWKDNDKTNPPYYQWQFQVVEGPHKGAGPYYYTTSLKPEALFNLRNLIHAALGKNVAGKSVSFNPESLIGKKIGIVISDEEYQGKIKSRAVDVFPEEEYESDDDQEEGDDEEEEDDEEAEGDSEEEEEDEDLEDVDLEDI